ncbi:MAG: hypothetical protein ACFB9N_14160 [Geitlerinemataceae cyanobacterium]
MEAQPQDISVSGSEIASGDITPATTTGPPTITDITFSDNPSFFSASTAPATLTPRGRETFILLDFKDGVDRFLHESPLSFDRLSLEAVGNATQVKLDNNVLMTAIGMVRSQLDVTGCAASS